MGFFLGVDGEPPGGWPDPGGCPGGGDPDGKCVMIVVPHLLADISD
jgi:hypothetical protein